MKIHSFILTGALSALAVTGLANSFPEEATFIGSCDASAASAIDREHFIVADDEDNILRVYHRAGGAPRFEYDVSEFIGNRGKKKAKEADLEASAQIGNTTFWITSHGRNSKGKETLERHRLFATEISNSDSAMSIKPLGMPYVSLVSDLIADERFARYRLAEAAELAPKSPGALNIEGLTATPDGRLLIGFRNPIRDGKALIIPLENPAEVVHGTAARFGDPIELNLGGLGIRSLGYYGDRYVIIAGASGPEGESQLFQWNGKDSVQRVEGVSFKSLNPEGIAFLQADGTSEYFVLSDDGSLLVDGVECKKLRDRMKKKFRGRLVKL